MIAYKGTKKQFDQDVLSGKIASKVRKELVDKGVFMIMSLSTGLGKIL